jgi:hypothetical protein
MILIIPFFVTVAVAVLFVRFVLVAKGRRLSNNAKLLQQPCETCWKNLAMLLETTTGTRIGLVPAIAPKKERTKTMLTIEIGGI